MGYHESVLATESIEALAIKDDGFYVDVTFGGGGHSRMILDALGEEGNLMAFDQDEDAIRNLPEDERLTFVFNNFRFLQRYLKFYDWPKVDGILADLGVSSHQFDEGERGFSYRFDAQLDMRMSQGGRLTAANIVNHYSKEDLQKLFSMFGEVRNARTLANRIVDQRELSPINTIGEFLGVIDPVAKGMKNRYYAQVFQALRMEVNDEIGALEEMLKQGAEALKPGGRFVVITFHSIEDRVVKRFFKSGNIEGKIEKDFYGNIKTPFKQVYKKVLTATNEELQNNSRSRSAKLRVVEKI